MIRVVVGSTNPAKLGAVGRACHARGDLSYVWEIVGKPAPSGVSAQPLSLDETIEGARNRVKALMDQVDVGCWLVGVESGTFRVGLAVFEFTYAFVHPFPTMGGASCGQGLSSAWRLPDHWVPTPPQELSQLAAERGFPAVGSTGPGISGVVSGGQLTRADLAFEAMRNALIDLRPLGGQP